MIHKIKSFTGFWVTVLVFLIAIPTYAFMTAYPGGPRDIYEHAKFDWNQQRYTKTIQVSLKNGFMLEDLSQFIVLNKTLTEADENTRIIITVDENKGGLAMLLEATVKQIKASKAYVIIKLNHFGFSCGTFVLNAGNAIFVPYDSLVLFHFGSMMVNDTVTGVPTRVKIKKSETNPQVKAEYANAIEMMIPFLSWVTADEFKRETEGEDIFLSGREICYKLNGRNPDVMFHLKDGCMIRGVK